VSAINLYFWIFALYALLIVPVNVEAQVVFAEGVRYRIVIRAFGISLSRGSEKRKAAQKRRKRNGFPLMPRGGIKRLLDMFRWRDAELKLHISFADAAATAVVCSLARMVLYTAQKCGRLPVRASVDMDFESTGSSLWFRCIADTRLGNITAAALRLWLAAARRMRAEEEKYAASH